uniref:Uncharacterized protein n=1 Tax=Phlebotomus papatasi TaxID=29031 RepID=A0A1B0DIG7_PHLPP
MDANNETPPKVIRVEVKPELKDALKILLPSRSFVPPTRDEESETQRKAHAKRVRETRRSTQGVTLDEIKSAEELVKKKNLNNNNSSANDKIDFFTLHFIETNMSHCSLVEK